MPMRCVPGWRKRRACGGQAIGYDARPPFRTSPSAMDFAFILDPLPLLKAYKDTSISMMRALARRGHRVFALEQADVYWRDGLTAARSRPLDLHADDHHWYTE